MWIIQSRPVPIVKGAFQVPVIRFFTEERYAKEFAETGRTRFTRLNLFSRAEDIRRDVSEGVGRVARGKVTFVTSGGTPIEAAVESVATNPIYLLCFSEASADISSLAQRFSSTVAVCIDDPETVNRSLPGASFELPPSRELVSIRVVRVRYDKDMPQELTDLPSAVALAFGQKPERFALEKEWRVAVILSGEKANAPEHLIGTIPISRGLRVQEF